jgi:hypothetical protein
MVIGVYIIVVDTVKVFVVEMATVNLIPDCIACPTSRPCDGSDKLNRIVRTD